MDSSVSETYSQQEGSAYNGHFGCLCYHPLFLFNQFGDLERAMLRRGNHHSAKFWRRVLLPVIERYRHLSIPKDLERSNWDEDLYTKLKQLYQKAFDPMRYVPVNPDG